MRAQQVTKIVLFSVVVSAVSLMIVAALDQQAQTPTSHEMGIVAAILQVPSELIIESFDGDGLSVFLFGSASEKHNYAKGRSTQFGKMSLATDDYLKAEKGWSEIHIHEVGHALGFSNYWRH